MKFSLLVTALCILMVSGQDCKELANDVLTQCDDDGVCSTTCGTAIDAAKAASQCLEYNILSSSNSTNNGTDTGKKLSVEVEEVGAARVDCRDMEPETKPDWPPPEPAGTKCTAMATNEANGVGVALAVGETTVHIAAYGPAGKWFAVGFGSETMSGYAIISEPGSDPAEWNMVGKGQVGEKQAQQDLTVVSDKVIDDIRYIHVSRPRVTSDGWNDPDKDEIPFNWAVGKDGTLAKHAARGVGTLTFGCKDWVGGCGSCSYSAWGSNFCWEAISYDYCLGAVGWTMAAVNDQNLPFEYKNGAKCPLDGLRGTCKKGDTGNLMRVSGQVGKDDACNEDGDVWMEPSETVEVPECPEDCMKKVVETNAECKDFGEEPVRQRFEEEGKCPKLMECATGVFECFLTAAAKEGAEAVAATKAEMKVRCDICRPQCLAMLTALGLSEEQPPPSVPATLKFDGVSFAAYEAKTAAEKATFRLSLRNAIAKQLDVKPDDIVGLRLSSGSVIVDFLVEYEDQAAAEAGKAELAQKIESGLDVTEIAAAFKTVDPNAAPVLDKAASQIKDVVTPPLGGYAEPEPEPSSPPGETPDVDTAVKLSAMSLV